jgi:SAM-dependent methyltransferase
VKGRFRSVRAVVCRYNAHCPVCGESFRDFIPLPVDAPDLIRDLEQHGYDMDLMFQCETLNVERYACPICRAVDRERLYALFIQHVLRRTSRAVRLRLLDIAPNHSLRKFLLSTRRFQYRSADLLMPDVDDKVDLQDMYIYPTESFDCFICSHVLEHVSDDQKALRELHRVLKPGGWGITMAPIVLSLQQTREDPSITDESLRVRLFGQRDHVRLYAKGDFVRRLESAGFKVRQLTVNDFGREVFQRRGIALRSVLYVCEKAK